MIRHAPLLLLALLFVACSTTKEAAPARQEPAAAPTEAPAPEMTPEKLQEACGREDAASCIALGELFMKGEKVPGDTTRALMSFERACDLNEALGCALAATLHEQEGPGQDLGRAAHLYSRACQQMNRFACTRLATFWLLGRGMPRNPAQAEKMLEATCDAGDPNACDVLGGALELGELLPRDLPRAAELYRRGCEGGEGSSCNQLGDMYENGRGVEQDVKRALPLYEKACSGGTGIGCASIGYLYENGNGLPKDPERAEKLYRQACELQSPEGCQLLAAALKRRSAPQSELFELYKKACLLGSEEACGEAARLKPSRP